MWLNEYAVSLRKPNKRYQTKLEDRVEGTQKFLLNIWRI